MSEQMPLFHLPSSDQAPGEPETPVEDPEGHRGARRPGWTLLGAPEGLWHLVARRRYDGMLTARCGVQGRLVDDGAREIMFCASCEAAESST